MRSSRGRRNRRDGGGAYSYLLIFVIGPIVSIILGAGVVKYVILPQFVPKEDTSNPVSHENTLEDHSLNYDDEEYSEETTELEKSTFSLNSLELHGIQIGNFSTMENAKTLVEELSKNKLSGYIVAKDGYRVLVGSYFTRQKADEKIDEIRKTYSDAFVSTAQIKGENIEYFIVDESYKIQLEKAVETLNDAFSKELTLWEEVLINKKIEDIAKLIEDNNVKIKNDLKEVDGSLMSPKLIDLVSKINDTISIREEIIKELKGDSREVSNIYKDYNNDLYDYIRFINEL